MHTKLAAVSTSLNTLINNLQHGSKIRFWTLFTRNIIKYLTEQQASFRPTLCLYLRKYVRVRTRIKHWSNFVTPSGHRNVYDITFWSLLITMRTVRFNTAFCEHSVLMCPSLQTATIPFTALTNRLVSEMEASHVLCELRTESLYTDYFHVSLQRYSWQDYGNS